VLEGAQAGLSWSTILNRREGYRTAYQGFDPRVVAGFGEVQEARLLADAGIVRNRAKVRSSIVNAQAFMTVQQEFGSFDAYIWSFVDGEPIQNAWRSLDELPATSPLSQRISADLKRRGFTFVGPTIVYAHMQATGMVNDHVVGCFRHAELGGTGE
jgi:DNA-3-methyladenine glycosylase I